MADGKKTTTTPQGARDVRSQPRLVLPIGQLGLYVDPNPLYAPDGSWRRLTNAEFGGVGARSVGRAMGGLRKRGGLAPWTSAALTGGSIMAAASIPLPSEIDLTPTLLIGANRETGSSGTAWWASTNGSTFTSVGVGLTPRPFYMGSGVSGLSSQPVPPAITYRRSVYYPADDFARNNPATERPPLASYQAGQGYEFGYVPDIIDSSASMMAYQVMDMTRVGTTLYFVATYGTGGVNGSRVYSLDLLTGTMETLPTPPDPATCVEAYQGRIWIGTAEDYASGVGGVYSINPDTETTWRSEHQNTTDGRRYVADLIAWNGELFAFGSNYNTVGVAAQIEKRTAAGTWSAVLTAPTGGAIQWFHAPIVFNGELYVGWTIDGTTEDSHIYKTSTGSSWTLDLDVTLNYAFKRPGHAQVFNDELYWPCYGPVAGNHSGSDDFVLKRTAAGVWSQVQTGEGLNGMSALYYPSL